MANVFATLNRIIARLDSDPTQQPPLRGGSNSSGHGFQILKNTLSSLPLEPWFDFIIGINGREISSADPTLFATEVRNCAGATVSLSVFGAKGGHARDVYVSVPGDGMSLGLALQWAPLSLTEALWHILDVIPNSPADVAGLLPYSDYVMASPDGALHEGEASLSALVEAFLDRPLRLHVYNHEYDITRLVTITPSRTWGGDGALGCVLGFGALHRMPAPLHEPAQAPGETLFDTVPSQVSQAPDSTSSSAPVSEIPEAEQAFLIPANFSYPSGSASVPSATSPAGPPHARHKKSRAHPTTATATGLDDYFAEGEANSRKMDGAARGPPAAGTDLHPPPPKAGGSPPKSETPAADVEQD